MATSNFVPHENGIFIIEDLSLEDAYDIYVGEQLEEGQEVESFEDINKEVLFNIIYQESEFAIDNIECLLSDDMLPHGMTSVKDDYNFTIFNKKGKAIALIMLESGYYSDMQLIVETDPYEILDDTDIFYWETKKDMYEEYSPHHKLLLKYISSITTPLNVVARFSNGETMYDYAS